MARRAVFSVVAENYDEVNLIKKFVSMVFNEFLEFNLRNSELRKKSDSIPGRSKGRLDTQLKFYRSYKYRNPMFFGFGKGFSQGHILFAKLKKADSPDKALP